MGKSIIKSLRVILPKIKVKLAQAAEEHVEPQFKDITTNVIPELLAGWDGEGALESKGASMFMIFLDHLQPMLMSNYIKEEQNRRILMDNYFNYLWLEEFFISTADALDLGIPARFDEICKYP